MKKKWWIFALLLIFSVAAKAQTLQITRMEYYFDTDPGVGNGGMMTLVPGDSVDMISTIAVWSSLTPGYHWLYMRSFYDSAGLDRAWSHTAAQQIYIPDSLVYAEYFYDTDPGQGAATVLSLTNTSDSFNQNFTIPVPVILSAGSHNLYVRSRSVSGKWSMAEPLDFYTPGAINGGEYFFGADPGVGNGTPFPFAVTDSLNTTLNIPLPVLPAGVHQVFVRTRTVTGDWGHAYPLDFYMNGAVVSGEYFFDTDPGTGNGTAFSFAPTGDSVGKTLTVNTTTLNGGEHRLYVRSVDNSGRWSQVDEAFFYLLPKIIRGEYYWDADPGVGNGTALFNGTTSDSINQNFALNAPCLPPGKHLLSVRTLDDQGKWSHVEYDSLTFSNPSMALAASLPGPGPFGTPVKLTATGGRMPYQYQLDSNPAGADSILLAPNETAVIFTATDSCGYTATASLTTPDDPEDISLSPTATGSVLLSGWGHWVYLLDGSGNIIGAVNDGRQNLGNTTISYKNIEAPDTVRAFNALPAQAHYLDRNWHIASARAPQQAVGIRLYGSDAALNRYTAAEPSVTLYSQLHLTKYNGPNEDLDYSNNAASGSHYRYYAPDSTGAFSGKTTTGFHASYHVPGFSEFYLNRDLNVPLSLSRIDVCGKAEADRIRIDWETAGEEDLLHYELMKQSGNGWELLETVAARNKQSSAYTAFDDRPVSGKNIYQVRVVEAAGQVSYSPAVVVYYNRAQTIAVFPNPATDFVNVNGVEAGSVLILTDISGKTISSQQATATNNRLSTEGLASGVYQLIIRKPNGEQIQLPVHKK